ncbi:MAG TPA: PAS domain-containing protein [Burkholderiales bacterium]|nr:PAS domain-containing protein [Burkholderiales bacterium]
MDEPRAGPARASPRLMEDAVPAMVWSARPDMSCDYLSRAWLEFTGCTPEQALGDGWSRGVHPEDLARWLDACVRAFDAREPFHIEYRLRRHDGEYRWVQDRGVPRFSPDGVFLGFVGSCVDVHERKRCEHELARALERERKLRIATEEASRIKDGFLASVLQDLQAPVQAIATWARHLRAQAWPTSEAADALEAIERNARAQDRIIADLLDLSRVAAGGAPAGRPAANEGLLANVRVLVAEPDAAARETIAKVLAVAGAKVHAAASGQDALRAIDAFHPDVVLSQVDLRGGDGEALIRQLRARPAERGGCVPAAALTTPSERAGGLRAVAAGYDAQLAKPVEPVALLATVARLAHPSV